MLKHFTTTHIRCILVYLLCCKKAGETLGIFIFSFSKLAYCGKVGSINEIKKPMLFYFSIKDMTLDDNSNQNQDVTNCDARKRKLDDNIETEEGRKIVSESFVQRTIFTVKFKKKYHFCHNMAKIRIGCKIFVIIPTPSNI